MVRRVGFGDKGERPEDGPRDDGPSGGDLGEGSAAPSGRPKGRTRLLVGAFLAVWLVGWSVAIAASINQIMADGLGAAETFLFVWTGVAIVFWVLAAITLWRVLTGRPLSAGRRRNWGRTPAIRGGVRRGDWDHGAHD